MLDAIPIHFNDVLAARERIGTHLPPSPLRNYAALDAYVGADVQVFVKHENHLPTNSFKVRNGLSFMTALDALLRSRGVVAATRGNHGLGLAWAGKLLGVSVTIIVPHGNNPEKNAGMRGLGARLIEEGADYDESVEVADRLVRDEGLTLAHSTNHPAIIAGAATMTLELLEQQPDLDVLVIAVGGGSQAVGALTVARQMRPGLEVYGVQAAGASAAHDSWHAKQPLRTAAARTFADGLATRSVYELTFPALRDGLAGFVTVTDAEIAEALRQLLETTHTLVEGAGAAGLAGLLTLRQQLAGKRVGIIISGGNIDRETLRQVVAHEL
ncbi:MAG: threonine ammonia-lyase [Gemmatimonadaceae bacterium]